MNNSYAETSVKKKVTAKDNMIKTFSWAAVAAVFFVGFLYHITLLFLVALAGAALAYYFLPLLNVTYEYVYCDGQIDFDKIMNGEKRKQLYRTDLDNAVVVCPKDSHDLDGYKYNNAPQKDFTSQESGRRVYAIVESAGEQNTILYFEPDDKMLGMIKQKAMRKFKEY